jgi:hypothetical protein
MIKYDQRVLINAGIAFVVLCLSVIGSSFLLPPNNYSRLLNGDEQLLYYVLAITTLLGFVLTFVYVGIFIGVRQERKYFNNAMITSHKRE